MSVVLPSLTYAYDALGKYISADIMQLHHAKHHQAYIDKFNGALEKLPADVAAQSVETILRHLDILPEEVRTTIRNNAGGHYNHSLFWQWLSPKGGGEPSGELAAAIVQRYGSYQAFVDEFSQQASSVFGSGWAWLMPDMSIITTPNQDSPLMNGLPEPLLGLDVWEHAYYLDYQNKRNDYISAWWHVVNWEFVDQRWNVAHQD